MQTASRAAFFLGGDTEKAGAAIQSLAENLGRVPQLSAASAAEFGAIASLSGATAESLGTIVELNALALGQSLDKSVSDLASLEALAEQEGVLKSQVFDDVAQSAKDQALFFGKSAVEIGKAAVEMRKLGIEAGALNRLAESLLDLESSISSEFELQLLFGKNINLNKAREAAFNRDSAALAREIKMQLGGQFDLTTANAAQVKALTDGFGLSQEELQKVIQGQDIFNSKTDEGNESLLKKFGLFVAVGTALGAILGSIIVGIKGLKGAGDMALGAKVGAGIGAGAGVAGKIAMEKFEDAHAVMSVDRKAVGSQSVGASFSVGDNSINVTKDVQSQLDLKVDKLVNVIREELVAEVKKGNKDNKETLGKVVQTNEEITRAVRKIM